MPIFVMMHYYKSIKTDNCNHYPPDNEPHAVNTVIEQAEMHAEELV